MPNETTNNGQKRTNLKRNPLRSNVVCASLMSKSSLIYFKLINSSIVVVNAEKTANIVVNDDKPSVPNPKDF